MLGLLLPLHLNLGGGGPPAPTHDDAPGDRLIAVEPETRVIAVDEPARIIPVDETEETLQLRKKDSGDTLDYTRDFGGWLESAEGIASVSWARVPASGLTIGASSYAPTVSSDGKRCTVWLSAGNTGVTYTVTATVTTNNSPARVVERSFLLEIEDQ